MWPGPGAGGAVSLLGDREVRGQRAGAVRCGAPDAADQPAVPGPPGRPGAGSRGCAAAEGTVQGPVQRRADRGLPRARGRAAGAGAADARGRAPLPGRRGRADPRGPAGRARQRRRLPVRRHRGASAREPAAGGAGPGPLPRPAAGFRGVRRDGPDHRRARPGPPERDHAAAPLPGRRDRPAPAGHRRLRATWLADCAGQIGLATFMHAAGITCSQRLGDLLTTLEPAGEAQAIRLLGGTP